MRDSSIEKMKPKALDFLKTTTMPITIGDVANHLDMSWSTARQVMMELRIEGRVECEKTTKSWIFRTQHTQKPTVTRLTLGGEMDGQQS